MRCLVIGDPHFREGFVKDMELFIENVIRVVSRVNVDFIVVLGDVMDRHGILHQKPFHQACRFLIELSKLHPTYCLIGNHDFDVPSKYLPENHPFKVMTWSDIPNLRIIDKPTIINGMFFTPYVPVGMFDRAVREALEVVDHQDSTWWDLLQERGIRLGFAHQEFKDCQLATLRSEHGDEWPRGKNYGEAPTIVSGHIHNHQILGDNMIIYPGTPIQVNHGESTKRGLCHLELDDITGKLTMEYHQIKMPQKLTKMVKYDDLESWVLKRYTKLNTRYSLEQRYDCFKKLVANRERLTELQHHVQTDKYVDSIKLQIVLEEGYKITTALKNSVMKIKELPLGVNQIYFIEKSPGNDEGGEGDEEEGDRRKDRTEDVKYDWLEMLLSRFPVSAGGEETEGTLLRNILNNLTNKT